MSITAFILFIMKPQNSNNVNLCLTLKTTLKPQTAFEEVRIRQTILFSTRFHSFLSPVPNTFLLHVHGFSLCKHSLLSIFSLDTVLPSTVSFYSIISPPPPSCSSLLFSSAGSSSHLLPVLISNFLCPISSLSSHPHPPM